MILRGADAGDGKKYPRLHKSSGIVVGTVPSSNLTKL